MMIKLLDIENWNRKEHFLFFSQFDEPFFGIVAEIDCTNAYQICKEQHIPFYLYYLHKSLVAVNQIEEFKYRILNNKITIFDTINVSSTINRDDNTFAFSFIPFSQSFNEFTASAQLETNRIRNSTGLGINENTSRLDLIHYSAIPWISFTGLTHARNLKYKDSVPKITFGKYFNKNGRLIMPVSINVHHGLMDGFHVGQYLQLFEQLINDK